MFGLVSAAWQRARGRREGRHPRGGHRMEQTPRARSGHTLDACAARFLSTSAISICRRRQALPGSTTRALGRANRLVRAIEDLVSEAILKLQSHDRDAACNFGKMLAGVPFWE